MHSSTQLVTDSIASFNSLFLDALARTAREQPAQLPLPLNLVGALSEMTASDCCERGAVRVCLAEAHFGDAALWRQTVAGAAEGEPSSAVGHWSSSPDRVLLAHSLFLVAWHGVHSMPSFTRILFGMDDEVSRIFRTVSFAGLFPLAEARSGWVYPRWRTRGDVWSGLLGAPIGEAARAPSSTLRLLQASARESFAMLSTAFIGSLQIDAVEIATRSRSTPPDRRSGSARPRKGK